MDGMSASAGNQELYVRESYTKHQWRFGGATVGAIVSMAVVVCAVVALFFAFYSISQAQMGTFALYHSVKVLVIGAVVTGLGTILTIKTTKKAAIEHEKLTKCTDKEFMDERLVQRQESISERLNSAQSFEAKSVGSLYHEDDNVVRMAMVADLRKSFETGLTHGFLGTILIIVSVVIFSMSLSSITAGVTTGNAMISVWLACGVAGGVASGGLLYHGVDLSIDTYKRKKAAQDLGDGENRAVLEAYQRKLGLHSEQPQQKLDKYEISV